MNISVRAVPILLAKIATHFQPQQSGPLHHRELQLLFSFVLACDT
jgi:hypothetical protein